MHPTRLIVNHIYQIQSEYSSLVYNGRHEHLTLLNFECHHLRARPATSGAPRTFETPLTNPMIHIDSQQANSNRNCSPPTAQLVTRCLLFLRCATRRYMDHLQATFANDKSFCFSSYAHSSCADKLYNNNVLVRFMVLLRELQWQGGWRSSNTI